MPMGNTEVLRNSARTTQEPRPQANTEESTCDVGTQKGELHADRERGKLKISSATQDRITAAALKNSAEGKSLHLSF